MMELTDLYSWRSMLPAACLGVSPQLSKSLTHLTLDTSEENATMGADANDSGRASSGCERQQLTSAC